MNKLAANLAAKKLSETAAEIRKAADEEIVISKRVRTLEIAVALLAGIVLGMFLSPRKKVSYKIASNNNINADENDEDEDYDENDDDFAPDDNGKNGKFIKL